MKTTNLKAAMLLTTAFALTMLQVQAMGAQTFQVIHTFTGAADGSNPQHLIAGPGGVVYGATYSGLNGSGGVYQLQQAGSRWNFKRLYNFAGGGDGAGPVFLTLGPNNVLYGSTNAGGNGNCDSGAGCGLVFKLTPRPTICPTLGCPWNKTDLYQFTGGSDGWGPRALAFNSGEVYGTAAYGGNAGCAFDDGCGAIFELSPSGNSWTETTLYDFTGGADGGNPDDTALSIDSAGNLYGTAGIGGSGCGTAFQLAPSGSGWTFNVVHTFEGGSDGGGPYSGMSSDRLGNLFGATYGGSTFGACPGAEATVFEYVPSTQAYSVIHDFGCTQCGAFGSAPVRDSAGNLWGTAETAGASHYGMVYELTFSQGQWFFHDVYEFQGGADGKYPASITVDANGNVFGVALEGGNSQRCGGLGCGVTWEITQ